MIIVVFVLSILLTALGIYITSETDAEISGCTLTVCGGLATLAAFITAIILCICVSNLTVIDQKIEMYEEENAKIESQLAETVAQYQQYEKDIFTEVSPDSSVTLVSLYPDLKSDTLVQKQIETYVSNNDTIKELKSEKISGKVSRWWLYFGG